MKKDKHTYNKRQNKKNISKPAKYSSQKKRKNLHKPQSFLANVKINPSFIIGWLLIVGIAAYISYIPAFENGITNFDDNLYITDNPYLKSLSGDNINAIFSNYYMGNYHPLSMLSLAWDYDRQPEGYEAYHSTNIMLHIANSLLVFWFIFMMFRLARVQNTENKHFYHIIPGITALLFAVHTIHLESVAWVSERKDVLYTLFFLASLISYIYYIARNKSYYFVISIVFFILSLLSKGQAVSLAVTLIAVDFVARRSLIDRKVIIEKVPFFALAIIFGVVAIFAQQSSESIAVNDSWQFHHRIVFASYGFFQYIFKLLAPINLSVFYPYPKGEIPALYFIFPLLVIGLIFLFLRIAKKYRFLAFGILFFAINIFLVLQLLPVGKAIMADRYAYIPSIGFFAVLAYGGFRLMKLVPSLLYIVPVVFFVYSGWLTHLSYERCKLWGSSLDLWNDVLVQFPDSELAYNNRGDILSNLEPPQYEKALSDFNRAIELDPNYDQTYYNRGVVKAHLGDKEGAMKDFNKAIELKPDYAQAYSNRGATRYEMGDPEGALKDFSKAIEYKPDYVIAYSNRGSAYARLGKLDEAIADFTKSLNMSPNNPKMLYMRGRTYLSKGDKENACNDLQKAVRLGFAQAQPLIDKYCK